MAEAVTILESFCCCNDPVYPISIWKKDKDVLNASALQGST